MQYVGLSRPIAPKADFRLFQIGDVFGLLAGPPGDRLLDMPGVGLDDLGDRLGLAVEAGVEPVDLDDQHGPGLGREAEAERLFDRPDHRVVEHLEGGRDDPRGDDPADGLRRRVDRVEDAQQGPAGLGVAGQVDDHLGDDPERPLVADDQAGQVVAGVILGDPAGLDDRAVGQDERRRP